MGRDVLCSLDCHLERVLDESFLADVRLDDLRISETPQLGDTGLDEGEFFGHKLRVGHGAAVSRLR